MLEALADPAVVDDAITAPPPAPPSHVSPTVAMRMQVRDQAYAMISMQEGKKKQEGKEKRLADKAAKLAAKADKGDKRTATAEGFAELFSHDEQVIILLLLCTLCLDLLYELISLIYVSGYKSC